LKSKCCLIGNSYYDAMQLTYTHRFSYGFSVFASYTFSKFIDNVAGNNGWAASGPTSIRDYYNLAAEKSVDSDDIPQSLVVSYIYELPFGRGKKLGSAVSAPVNTVIGGWQVSGVSTFKQGFPLSIMTANNTLGQFGGNRRPNVVAGYHVPNPTIDRWFNLAAFQDPSNPFDFGNAQRYISQLRAPGYQNWDLSMQKYWHFTESMRLPFRAELFNAWNHPQVLCTEPIPRKLRNQPRRKLRRVLWPDLRSLPRTLRAVRNEVLLAIDIKHRLFEVERIS